MKTTSKSAWHVMSLTTTVVTLEKRNNTTVESVAAIETLTSRRCMKGCACFNARVIVTDITSTIAGPLSCVAVTAYAPISMP
jgi:hypothetical protein